MPNLQEKLAAAEAQKDEKIVLKIFQYKNNQKVCVDVKTAKPPVPTNNLLEQFGSNVEQEDGDAIFDDTITQPGIYFIENSKQAGSIALDTYYQMLDPQNRTESSVATDRSSCFTYYSANQKGKVRCTVLGANFDRQCIRAAHIMQRRWLGRAGTPAYKSLTDALGINSHSDVRNMLPMHLGVETLFDLGFICFRQVDNNDELLYEINVLNDKDPLMQLSLDQLATQKLASHEKHFGTQQRMLRLSSGSPKHTGRLKGKELDGMSFRVQAGDAPSKRCIAIHALLCIRLAERKGWINRGIMDIEEAAWLSPGCTKEKRQQLLSWIPNAL